MMSNAKYLYSACVADYEMRWPDHEPPSLEECQEFIDNLEME